MFTNLSLRLRIFLFFAFLAGSTSLLAIGGLAAALSTAAGLLLALL